MNATTDPRDAIETPRITLPTPAAMTAATTLRQSESMAAIAPALVAAFAKLHAPDPKTWRKVQVRTTSGNYEFRYATFDQMVTLARPILAEQGLCVIQPIVTTAKGTPALVTRLLHKSGEWMEAEVPLPPLGSNPQAFGSSVTYVKRYSLGSMLGIAGEEDDDGNGAAGNAVSDAASGQRQQRGPAEDRGPGNGTLRQHAQDMTGQPRDPEGEAPAKPRRTLAEAVLYVHERLDQVTDGRSLFAVIDDPQVQKVRAALKEAEPGGEKAKAGSEIEQRIRDLDAKFRNAAGGK